MVPPNTNIPTRNNPYTSLMSRATTAPIIQ
jgi:hypothetical protein